MARAALRPRSALRLRTTKTDTSEKPKKPAKGKKSEQALTNLEKVFATIASLRAAGADVPAAGVPDATRGSAAFCAPAAACAAVY